MKDINALKQKVRENVEKQGMVSPALIENIILKKLRVKDNDIESYYFPVRSSCCLSAKNILDIILLKCPYKFRNLLLTDKQIITEKDIRDIYVEYLEESYYVLSDEELRLLLVRDIYSEYEFGQLSSLINIGMFDVYAGSICKEVLSDKRESRLSSYVAAGVDGVTPKRLEFLQFEKIEELERVIRVLLLMNEGVEFTARKPVYKTDFVYAVRPPVEEWGIAIRKGDSKKWSRKFVFTD